MPATGTVALLDDLTALVELVTAGGGLAGLQRMVEIAAARTGAAGATFVEYTATSGRVVAATSDVDWVLGRPVDVRDPAYTELLTGLLAGPRVGQSPVDALPAGSADQLTSRGLHRVLTGVTGVDGNVVGSLHVYFRDADGEPDAEQLGVVRFLLAGASYLYRERAGLPLYPDATVPRPDRAAERAESRDLFIAMTSHELRTPVTVIKGYADTLVERWDSLADPARREAVFVVWHRARDLARLVDRLLNAAADLAGPHDTGTLVPFDPAGALRDAATELAGELRRSVRVNLPEKLPAVRGERSSLATVLTELVNNACKYSPEQVDVEVTAGSDERTVWLRVTDRGLGIRPEHTERAFERYWQLDTGDQRRYGGVGLGLYLVRRIVERQNGWVSLRPRDGGGTVAEVRLPRVDAAAGGIG